MGKICDWYKEDICDCFCDGLNANCKNYSGDLYADTDTEEQIKEYLYGGNNI